MAGSSLNGGGKMGKNSTQTGAGGPNGTGGASKSTDRTSGGPGGPGASMAAAKQSALSAATKQALGRLADAVGSNALVGSDAGRSAGDNPVLKKTANLVALPTNAVQADGKDDATKPIDQDESDQKKKTLGSLITLANASNTLF